VASNGAQRSRGNGGYSRGGTALLVAGSLVVGALLAVGIMAAVSPNNSRNAASSGQLSTTAGSPTTTSRVATHGAAVTHRATTTQRVTTTTSRTAALAELVSRVKVVSASKHNYVVTVRAPGAHIKSVQIGVSPVAPGPHGHFLAGSLDAATGQWHSTGAIYPRTTYTVHFVVTGTVGTAAGLVAHGSRTFTTAPPAQTVTATVFPTPGISVGVGEPIIFMFSQPIDTYAAQQAVLSHIHIAMSQPVPGGWHWFSSVELHFRPTSYWPIGDGVQVTANLSDWDAGAGAWGGGTLSTAFIIGEARISTVNLATHQMTVSEDGKVLYSWPISGGSAQLPTMNGTHIVMDRESVVDMNSASVGIAQGSPGAYNEKVYWDVHISDSGEYVHAAPWSISEQGLANVSHGCVNLSPERAVLFFRLSRVGDIVQVVGGPRPPVMGDHGVMDWSFNSADVIWSPATVAQLTTPVTTVPTTTTPPPAGAPT
jgi:lipoprotein-anchoring transpeptidase ErfK/SrfK